MDEALRLMRMSKVSLLDSAAGGPGAQRDPVTAVYEALRDDAQRSGSTTYAWADLNALLGHKFTVRAVFPHLHCALLGCMCDGGCFQLYSC